MRLIKSIFCTLILSSTSVIADDQSETLENFSCNYAEGKDFDDVISVAKTWDKWADDTFSVPYQAFLFTPFFSPAVSMSSTGRQLFYLHGM